MQRRRVIGSVVALALFAALIGALWVTKPLLRATFAIAGEVELHGVHTVLAGRSDDVRGVWGLNMKSGRVVLTDDGCLALDRIEGTGFDGTRLISWPRGSHLTGTAENVHVLLPSGERVGPGDVISFGAHAGFSPTEHVHLPEACRWMEGIHLQTTLGEIEVSTP